MQPKVICTRYANAADVYPGCFILIGKKAVKVEAVSGTHKGFFFYTADKQMFAPAKKPVQIVFNYKF